MSELICLKTPLFRINLVPISNSQMLQPQGSVDLRDRGCGVRQRALNVKRSNVYIYKVQVDYICGK